METLYAHTFYSMLLLFDITAGYGYKVFPMVFYLGDCTPFSFQHMKKDSAIDLYKLSSIISQDFGIGNNKSMLV